MPTLKELTAEYDRLKEQKESDQAVLNELKPKLSDLKQSWIPSGAQILLQKSKRSLTKDARR